VESLKLENKSKKCIMQLKGDGKWDLGGFFGPNNRVEVTNLEEDTEYIMRAVIKEKGANMVNYGGAKTVAIRTKSCQVESLFEIGIK